MNIVEFKKVAPYLTHPLVLVGFGLMLAYSIHWQLMKSGLLRQASQKDSSLIIRLFLRYGFWLALVLLLAGVGLQFSDRDLSAWNSYMDKEAAAAARHLGALAYLNSPQEALVHYQKAVQLDPDNAEGWNQLGNLLRRTGELARAEEAFRKVLALAQAHQDKEKQAWAYGNLGLVYQTRGDLDKAEEMHRKALELNKTLGSEQGIAQALGNLGIVYWKSGELDKAEGMYRKSLNISEALDLKQESANQYTNLGIVYKQRGNMEQAEEVWKKSLSLYQEMGAEQHPDAKKVQSWLDELTQQRSTTQ